MEPIKRRRFGSTGLEVTQVSLGAMNLRMLDSEDDAKAMIHKALDMGINLLDTARVYNEQKPDGRLFESETFVKEALCEHEKLDEPVIVITKGHGYNHEAFDEDLHMSRQKLGIETLHDLKIGAQDIKLVYFFHGVTRERYDEMKASGALKHALALKNQGYFDYLGFSSHNGHEQVVCEAIDSGYFQVVELPYNVFAPGFGQYTQRYGNILKKAHQKGVAIINMKAFGGTSMVTNTKIFKDYCDISPQNRLRYCLSNPYIATVDAGCRYPEELDADIAVSHMEPFSGEECAELEGLAKRVAQAMEGECRECTHCLEKFSCPEGLDFPKLLALHTRYKLSREFSGDIDEIKNAYSLIEDKADKCAACGQCLEWCEYRIDIPGLLEQAHTVLGS